METVCAVYFETRCIHSFIRKSILRPFKVTTQQRSQPHSGQKVGFRINLHSRWLGGWVVGPSGPSFTQRLLRMVLADTF